mmetsp:Transcript_17587/g.26349  ORF Transcript_17587/g.26349 Transcript_17587/m.26349 type:complete len:374 (-) Transcript_17587:747-1868(-)
MDYKRAPVRLSAIQSFRNYVEEIISTSGMKALLVDKDTMTMISLVISQTEIISKQVFIVETIEGNMKGKKSQMNHLKAVCILRPTKKSLSLLEAALRKPRFKEYHIFFTNFTTETSLKSLASADEFELVKQVREFYADYYAVNHDLFHTNQLSTRPLYAKRSSWTPSSDKIMDRNVEGLLAMLLAAKKRPVVRYQRGSRLAKDMAIEVVRGMKEENEVFDFRDSTQSILLVMDRREDPIAPLLMQWTYQAMVHELLTITNNRVDMKSVPNVKKDMMQVVMSITQDEFFAETHTYNYGDLGKSIKNLVNKYKEKKTSQKNRHHSGYAKICGAVSRAQNIPGQCFQTRDCNGGNEPSSERRASYGSLRSRAELSL